MQSRCTTVSIKYKIIFQSCTAAVLFFLLQSFQSNDSLTKTSDSIIKAVSFGIRARKFPDNIKDIYEPVIIKNSPGNEATVIKLSSGIIKIFFINRPGKGDKMMSISSDDGINWADPQKEFDLPGEAYYANQVMQDKNGTIHCVFHIYGTGTKGYKGRHLNLWYTQMQNGKNWEAPKKIWDGYIGSLRGFIQLKNNRLLIPMSEADSSRSVKPETGSIDYGLFSTICLYSDDEGKTWAISDGSLNIPIESSQTTRYGAIEPNIIELKDGKLWMLIRTNKGFLYQSYSTDYGITWQQPQPSPFISSDSPATLLRLSDGSIVLFWCSNQRYDDKRSYAIGGREVLHAAISNDEGITWTGFREVLTGMPVSAKKGDRGTAYPSAIETNDGKILFAAGQGDEKAIVVFNPNWLKEKKAADNFSNGLVQWTLFGADTACVFNTQIDKNCLYIKKNTSKKNNTEAVWNFPMTRKGVISIQLIPQKNWKGICIALNDLFSVSYDSLASKNAAINFSLVRELKNKPETISIQWDTQKKWATIYLNNKILMKTVFQKPCAFGLNYLRIGIPGTDADENGYYIKTVSMKRKHVFF